VSDAVPTSWKLLSAIDEQSLLPAGWQWVSVDDIIIRIEAGRSFKCEERPPEEGEVGVAKVSAVTWGEYDEDESKTCFDTNQFDPALLIREGDFLFSRANTIQLVGACVIARRVRRHVMLSDKTLRLRLVGVPPKWLLYVLRAGLGRRQIERLATGNQESMRNIGQDRIRRIRIPLAPLSEMERVTAEIERQFTRLDAAVDALQRVRVRLDRYRTAVLRAAREGRLVSNELDAVRSEHRLRDVSSVAPEPTADEGLSRVWEDVPALPAGWAWVRVEDAGTVTLGRQRSPQHHNGPHMRPYLRVANVFEDRIDTTDAMEMNFTPGEYETYGLKYGDILLNEGQSLEWLGRPAMFRDEIPGACFQNTLVRFRAGAAVDPRYALIVFRSYMRDGTFRRVARWTVNIAHLGAGRFAKLPFPLPPLTEQQRIVAEVERRLSVVEELEAVVDANLKRAERLRQTILKRAFEGKLVPQDPTDEPASVLLERIRAERAALPAPRRGRANGRAAGAARQTRLL